MKQVTYEEALEIIRNNITQAYIYACYKKSTKQNTGILEEQTHRMVEILEGYIKPPTWEEVVKAWEAVDKCLNVYIHNNEFCVTDIDEEATSVFWYDIKTGGYEFECVSMEMIYAINLTIRYLEVQEVNNDR